MTEPTRGASEDIDVSWTASPWLARLVRVAILVLPLVAAWLIVRVVGPFLVRPDGGLGLASWIGQAAVLASVTSWTVDRLLVRFLPLATLLGMSLTFPDQAPSRFGIALRSGTVRKLEARLTEAAERGLDPDESTAARQAIELVTLLGRHERLTRGHTERVRAYTDLIAQEMGINERDRERLAWAALLHDIGKLTVPAAILNKDGRPNDEEWQILRGHPAAGEAFLEPLSEWLGQWKGASSEHHERWDGKGYPRGLAATEISLAGRIVAAADAYDVITSRRSYKAPMSPAAARSELVRCAGSQFDPEVVRALLRVSLAERRRRSMFAWLPELPRVANLGSIVSVGPAAAIAGLIGLGSLSDTAQPATVDTPDGLAFVDPADERAEPPVEVQLGEGVQIESGTATTAPSAPPTTGPTTTAATGESTTSLAPGIPGATASPTSTTLPGTPSTVAVANVPGTGSTTTTRPATTTTRAVTTTAPTTTTTTTPTTTTTAPIGPLAADDTHTTLLGLLQTIDVLPNDRAGSSALDPDTLRIVSGPSSGTAYVSGGTIKYRPALLALANSLTYEICDDNGLCDRTTVSIVL